MKGYFITCCVALQAMYTMSPNIDEMVLDLSVINSHTLGCYNIYASQIITMTAAWKLLMLLVVVIPVIVEGVSPIQQISKS